MGTYVLKRLATMVPLLVGTSLIVFFLLRLVPGDVIDAQLSMETFLTPEARAELRKRYGLDEPILLQFSRWSLALLQGDMSYSFRTSEPVLHKILLKLPVTLELSGISVLLSAVMAIPLGVASAINRNSKIDFSVRLLALLGLSLPSFWFATLLILIASRLFHWFPPTIYTSPLENFVENLQQMLLPALSLSLILMAVVMRLTRSSMLEVLNHEYVRTARAKGLGERAVLYRHCLRNALIPVVTIVGLQMGTLLGGVVIIEQIFALPGIGWLLLNAIFQRDYPVVQGVVLIVAFMFIVVNLFVDLAYAYLDPRIHYG